MNPRIALCIATIMTGAACSMAHGPGDTPMAATPDAAINMTPGTHPEPIAGSIQGGSVQAGGGQGGAGQGSTIQNALPPDAGVMSSNGGTAGFTAGTGTGGIPGFTGTGGTGFSGATTFPGFTGTGGTGFSGATTFPGFTGTGGTGFNNGNTGFSGFTGTGGTGFVFTNTGEPTVGDALDAGLTSTSPPGGPTVSSRAASSDVFVAPAPARTSSGSAH